MGEEARAPQTKRPEVFIPALSISLNRSIVSLTRLYGMFGGGWRFFVNCSKA